MFCEFIHIPRGSLRKVKCRICLKGMQQVLKVRHKYVIQTRPYRNRQSLDSATYTSWQLPNLPTGTWLLQNCNSWKQIIWNFVTANFCNAIRNYFLNWILIKLMNITDQNKLLSVLILFLDYFNQQRISINEFLLVWKIIVIESIH